MVGAIVSGSLIIGGVLLILLSKNYQKEDIERLNKKEYPLYQLMPTGLFIVDRLFHSFHTTNMGRNLQKKLALIYGHRESKMRLRQYLADKICYVLLTALIVSGISFILSLQNFNNAYLIQGNQLKRPEYHTGETTYPLVAVIENEEETYERIFNIPVSEQQLTLEEIEGMMDKITVYIEQAILGENPSLNYIQYPLRLMKSIPNTRWTIKWTSDQPAIVKTDGSIYTQDVEPSGQPVLLTAEMTHGDYVAEYSIPIRVYPREVDLTELINKELDMAIEQADNTDLTEPLMTLPVALSQEVKIRWYEPKNHRDMQVLIIGLSLALSLFFIKDEDLKKKVDERNKQLKLDFPEFISKLTLLIGAGMTVSKAWGKIVADYQVEKEKTAGEKRYLYEEALFTWYEIQGGISELTAYEAFGKRCQLPEYMKFSSLILQNMRKGTSTLLDALKEQADEAWEKRKEVAKTLGEQASTKLLFPMVLMLLVVIIIIMVPAMMSMGM